MKGLTGLLRTLAGTPQPWRPTGQPYPSLRDLDVVPLAKQAGVYALWHLGVRPCWMRIGGAADLGVAVTRLKAIPEVLAAAVHEGVYLAWAQVPVNEIPAAVASLAAVLRPSLQALDIPGEIKAAAGSVRRIPAAARHADGPATQSVSLEASEETRRERRLQSRRSMLGVRA